MADEPRTPLTLEAGLSVFVFLHHKPPSEPENDRISRRCAETKSGLTGDSPEAGRCWPLASVLQVTPSPLIRDVQVRV
jgi:hypothetical protein